MQTVKIIFFTHADFLKHQSMPRFTNMLADGMIKRGHQIEIWKPEPKFFNFSKNHTLNKWLGYIDQYIIFPKQVRRRLKNIKENVLYVFIDQALGPWVPLVSKKAHVVHCHDFLAQFSAMGLISNHKTSFTGKLYQNFIRKGYSQAKNFIAVSQKTKDDLLSLLSTKPRICEVVYNGLNQNFTPSDHIHQTRELLGQILGISLEDGFMLHVGGNQWYKNRLGVIEIYNSWRSIADKILPLLLIGEQPNTELLEFKQASAFANDIHFISGVTDEKVRMAYCGATLLLFPSLAEGFGWPIAEAMASGCPVITTNEMPMTEVAGDAGIFIPLKDTNSGMYINWANEAATRVQTIVELTLQKREDLIIRGVKNARRFETDAALEQIESIYQNIISNYNN